VTATTAGSLTLLQLTAPGSGEPVAAALAVQDAAGGPPALYVVPRELLVLGPNGEYVFAADAMAQGTLHEDLARVVGAPIDASYRVPLKALVDLAGAGELQLTMAEPASLQVGGAARRFEDGALVAASEVPGLFAASGPGGYDAVRVQQALWSSLLGTAALRPQGELGGALARAAAAGTGSSGSDVLKSTLKGLTGGRSAVAQFPAAPRVAEGQFAFVPDADRVLAEIRRHSPSYRSRFTVQVENGTGQVGVGTAVAGRLAVLDVNLPPVVNADSFDYEQTRIMAGRDALQVAQEVRAILGRGVVLDSSTLPADSVVVIVGADTELSETPSKDQQ
jgi:hypothetical protein